MERRRVEAVSGNYTPTMAMLRLHCRHSLAHFAALAMLVCAGCAQWSAPEADPVLILLAEAEDQVALGLRWNKREHYERAEALLEDVLVHDPDHRTAKLALAFLLAPVEGQPGTEVETPARRSRAETLLLEASAVEADRTLARFALGEMFEAGEPEEAVAHFEQVRLLNPEDSLIRYRLAKVSFLAEKPERTRRYAQEAIEYALASDNHFEVQEAKHILGRLAMEQGDFRSAEALIKEALINEDGSHWACAYQGLGELYSRIQDNGAVKLQQAAADVGDNPDLLYASALGAWEEGDRSSALAQMESAIAGEGRPYFQVSRGFLLLLHKRYDEAEATFRSLEAAGTEPMGVAVGLGHLAIARREYEDAEPRLREALDAWLQVDMSTVNNPGYYDLIHRMTCLGLGWVHANQNRHQLALPYFERVLSHRPRDLLGLLAAANSYIALHDLPKAEEMVQRVLAEDPENPFGLSARALIAMDRDEQESAEQDFRAALIRDKTNYTCPYEGLGLLYLKQGRIEEARENLQRAIDINPDIEYRKFNGLARIYLGEGRYDEAEKLLHKSHANFPDDDEATQLLKELGRLRSGAAQ